MIKSVKLKNFGPLEDMEWKNIGSINLVIGKNSTGKTFLLKALYTAVKTIEGYKRNNENRSVREILADKLYWTFQPGDSIGNIVAKGQDSLSFEMQFSQDGGREQEFLYDFGNRANGVRSIRHNNDLRERHNSIFLPTKEVLSLSSIITRSRVDRIFGFDDTYYDLINALVVDTAKGNFINNIKKSRDILEGLLGGRADYNSQNASWSFKRGNSVFSMGVTAEGIKKIAILDRLLGNRYLTEGSIIFIDEPEFALHPAAISTFLDIIKLLADCGMQIFIASHSYFVVKKLYLIAQKDDVSIPVLSFEEDEKGKPYKIDDLKDGMPDNAIIDEAVKLYDAEIELEFPSEKKS